MMSRSRMRLALGLGLLMTWTVACGGGSQPTDTVAAGEAPVPEPGEHTWVTPDGNHVPYTVGGKSDAEVTVVLVHCWMCNRSFWDAQLPALAATYRTVTLDLPGHGEATSERSPWTVAGYGEDVAGLVRALELKEVVLVGHSMGGPVSLHAAALLPGTVRGIVAVETLHNADFKFEGEAIEGFLRAFEEDYVGTCERFVSQMFPEENVESIIEKVRLAGCDEARGDVGTALMRNFGAIDMPAWFRQAGVPIRAINAAAPNPTQIEINRNYADFDAVLMDDVGHYLYMTRPETFNPLMLKAISAILGQPLQVG